MADPRDAFDGWTARLQDTAGDKLPPASLSLQGEPAGTVLDKLDRVPRLGLPADPSNAWVAAKALGERVLRECILDPSLLAQAANRPAEAFGRRLLAVAVCVQALYWSRLRARAVG